MKGDLVIARAYKGEPIILRVWSETDRGVWLTDEAEYQLLINDEGGRASVLGFPREDVFRYDPEFASTIKESWESKTWSWNHLTPY